MTGLDPLPITEQRNPRSLDLDALPTDAVLRLINAEDHLVAPAVAAELPHIADAVDAVVRALGRGGRLLYVGAGTSGRIGYLDAVECPPTFGTPPEQVQPIIAGGLNAEAAAELEDDVALGAQSVRERNVGSQDVVVGLAASGATPFVLGALEESRRRGAVTVAVTCVPGSPVAAAAHIAITPVVGPEVLTGSTRLKAGTAQKLICNMLTTAAMVRLGKVYGNLMVDLQPRNRKLAARAVRVVAAAADCEPDAARRWLEQGGGNAKVAIVMARGGVDRAGAEALLAAAGGHVRRALAAAGRGGR